MTRRKASAKNREILGKHKYSPPMDSPMSRDHTVTQDNLTFYAKIPAAMNHKGIQLHKTARIQQLFQPFPGRALAGCPLPIQTIFPAT
jgi:hypothetical protein